MTKTCKKCGMEKELNSIYFCMYNRKMRDGSFKKYFRIYCRECEKTNAKIYRINNPEYTKEYNSRLDVKLNRKQWNLENGTYKDRKEYLRDYKRKYNLKEDVKIKRQSYQKQRINKDPVFKVRRIISNAILYALKKSKTSKGGKSVLQYLDYDICKLKQHIENQFDNNMNWENHGIYWHIDHIIPQSCLPYTSMEDENFKICWALNNLRPLEAKLNIIEGSSRIRHKLFRGEI